MANLARSRSGNGWGRAGSTTGLATSKRLFVEPNRSAMSARCREVRLTRPSSSLIKLNRKTYVGDNGTFHWREPWMWTLCIRWIMWKRSSRNGMTFSTENRPSLITKARSPSPSSVRSQ